jgi:hypothetical protein
LSAASPLAVDSARLTLPGKPTWATVGIRVPH